MQYFRRRSKWADGLTESVGFVVVCEDAPLHVHTHITAAAVIVQAHGSHHGRHRSADHHLPTHTAEAVTSRHKHNLNAPFNTYQTSQNRILYKLSSKWAKMVTALILGGARLPLRSTCTRNMLICVVLLSSSRQMQGWLVGLFLLLPLGA
jgi:hypothetical protein